MTPMDQLPPEALAVIRAWTDPGRVPAYHEQWQRRLRAEWPALATALDAMARRHHA